MEPDVRFTGIKVSRAAHQSIISIGNNTSGAVESLREVVRHGHGYQYGSLNSSDGEIRLLYLQPGLPSEPLRCSLRHVQIPLIQGSQSKPNYEAISYVWGNPTRCENCIIDECLVKIPGNAAQVLRRFRTPDATRVLWIDAICINQDDIVERGEQVAIMARIYKHCSQCLVWLGGDSGQAKDAFAIIYRILETAAQRPDQFPGRLHITQPTDWYNYTKFPIGLEFDLTALDWFFSRPWFSRKWTIQEATIPDNVTCYCGSFDISIIDLAQATLCLYTKNIPNISEGLYSSLASIMSCYYLPLLHSKDVYDKTSPWSMGEILDSTSESQVSDPRDAIYAVLGLFESFFDADQNIMRALLRPDYNKSLCDVLCGAVKASVLHEKKLHCFLYIHQRFAPDLLDADDIPSWVPLWHKRLDLRFNNLCSMFDASDGLEIGVQLPDASHYEDDLRLLHCKSTIIDMVSHIYEYLDTEAMKEPGKIKELILWLWGHICKQSSPYQCEDDHYLLRVLALTLMAGQGYTSLEAVDEADIDAFAKFFEFIMLPNMPETVQGVPFTHEIDFTLVEENPEQRELLCSLGAIRRAAEFRVAFVTSSGIIGMGPSNMQIGDALVLLHGCPCPAILRHKGDQYEFLEVCYAHGYMWGPEHWPPSIEVMETTVTLK